MLSQVKSAVIARALSMAVLLVCGHLHRCFFGTFDKKNLFFYYFYLLLFFDCLHDVFSFFCLCYLFLTCFYLLASFFFWVRIVFLGATMRHELTATENE